MVNREIDPFALRVMNIGSFHAGTAKNVVADCCRMGGTVRTHSEEVANFIMRRTDEIVHSIAREMGGEGCVTVEKYLPPVANDPLITSRLMASAEKVVGKENVVVMEKPKMSSEDFAFYQTRKPGVFFRIGSRNETKGIASMPHRSDWDIDEDALPIAVRVFVQFVVDSMNGL
jgi:metal-dependent amidase/aminoacylase/carboxypeptidase family protein